MEREYLSNGNVVKDIHFPFGAKRLRSMDSQKHQSSNSVKLDAFNYCTFSKLRDSFISSTSLKWV